MAHSAIRVTMSDFTRQLVLQIHDIRSRLKIDLSQELTRDQIVRLYFNQNDLDKRSDLFSKIIGEFAEALHFELMISSEECIKHLTSTTRTHLITCINEISKIDDEFGSGRLKPETCAYLYLSLCHFIQRQINKATYLSDEAICEFYSLHSDLLEIGLFALGYNLKSRAKSSSGEFLSDEITSLWMDSLNHEFDFDKYCEDLSNLRLRVRNVS